MLNLSGLFLPQHYSVAPAAKKKKKKIENIAIAVLRGGERFPGVFWQLLLFKNTLSTQLLKSGCSSNVPQVPEHGVPQLSQTEKEELLVGASRVVQEESKPQGVEMRKGSLPTPPVPSFVRPCLKVYCAPLPRL